MGIVVGGHRGEHESDVLRCDGCSGLIEPEIGHRPPVDDEDGERVGGYRAGQHAECHHEAELNDALSLRPHLSERDALLLPPVGVAVGVVA